MQPRNAVTQFLFAAAVLGATAAHAQFVPSPDVSPGPKAVDMTGIDKDSDRRITRDEAQQDAQLAAEFDTLDRDRDGELDMTEFAAFEEDSSVPRRSLPAEDQQNRSSENRGE